MVILLILDLFAQISQILSVVIADPTAVAHELSAAFSRWGEETYHHGGFPEREVNSLRQAGLLAVTLPGESLSVDRPTTAPLLQLLKLIGRGNLSAGRIYEGHVNALQLIHLYGSAEQRERWFSDARAGHLFGVWNTEAGDGVRLHRRRGGGAQVQGSKTFCSGSVNVTRPLVTGRWVTEDLKPGGWQMTVLPLDELTVGVNTESWQPLGMRNSVSHRIDFSGIEITERELLGLPDQYECQPHFSGGAIRFAAVHLGGAEALLDATGEFLRRVNRTDDAHQRTRMGEMAILVESGNAWLDRSAHLNDQCDDPNRIVTYANMTRTAIAESCIRVIQLAERCVGARGLCHPEPFARLHTDLSMYLRQPAPDATLEQVGAYHLNQLDTFHHLWGR